MGWIPITSPDWSKDMYVKDDPLHGTSKWLGGHRQLEFISKETGSTENSTTEADATEPAVVKNKLEEWYAEAIQWLTARGVSENVAHRNLRFLMEYLDKHPHDAPPLLTNTVTK